MRRADSSRSQIVAWLKILLPLAALALLSTLFLLSRGTDEAMNVAVPGMASDGQPAGEGVRGPAFSGVTDRGDMIALTARTARPADGGRIEVETVTGALSLQDGARIDLDAAFASVGAGDDAEIELRGGVRIETSDGYSLTTDRLVTRLDGIEATAPGPVTGEGPVGRLEAGAMRLTREGGSAALPDAPAQMLFTGGVKLVYDPRAQ